MMTSLSTTRADRRAALAIMTGPCLAMIGGARIAARDRSQVELISNNSVDWEITPTVGAIAILDEPAQRLTDAKDRLRSAEEGFRLLDDRNAFAAGHVILNRLFGRFEPCAIASPRRAGVVDVYAGSLHVELRFSTDASGSPRKRVSYPDVPKQFEEVRRSWQLERAASDEGSLKSLLTPRGDDQGRRSASPAVPEREVRGTVDQVVDQGPTWKPFGLGVPRPVFPTRSLAVLRNHREVAAVRCVEVLMREDQWVVAHLLLSALFGTGNSSHTTSRSDGFNLYIDGLTIRHDVERLPSGMVRESFSYPRGDLEKHLLRYRWMLRTRAGYDTDA